MMARPGPAARVAVKVFVEQRQVAPVRVLGVPRFAAVARAAAAGVGQEDFAQPPPQLLRRLEQVHPLARARRAFNLHMLAVEMMVLLEILFTH